MTASSHRSFSSLCPTAQALVIRLLQEELQPLLQVPDTIPLAAWSEAIHTANPTLVCQYTDVYTIKISPESRLQLLQVIQQEVWIAA